MDRKTPRPLEARPSRPFDRRILALDVRRRKAGFVVIEGGERLLDWGVRTYYQNPRQVVSAAGKQFEELIECYHPSAIVARPTVGPHRETATAVRRILRRLHLSAANRGLEVEVVQVGRIDDIFAGFGCRNKHQINVLLAGWFDELYWKLPPKRKPWQPERWVQTIFDATAATVTFLTAEPDQ
jgi:hypothetical protein